MVILILECSKNGESTYQVKSPIIANLENNGLRAPQCLKHGHLISFVSFRKLSEGEIHFQHFAKGRFFVLTVSLLILPDLLDLSICQCVCSKNVQSEITRGNF